MAIWKKEERRSVRDEGESACDEMRELWKTSACVGIEEHYDLNWTTARQETRQEREDGLCDSEEEVLRRDERTPRSWFG